MWRRTVPPREAFFAKSQACLRASPLGKRHGWGLHHDAEGRVALVPLGSARCARRRPGHDPRRPRLSVSRRRTRPRAPSPRAAPPWRPPRPPWPRSG
ncbi:DUF6157 family protein [Micrococcus sp. 2A]|uniref:DUF6157 family protein n=1 Tax=Micrococcus sp. 2A TaxID=3142261 RepID=UPI0026277A36|nr:DUF6157 family protein [uncultured Micrococcus sp.]